MATSWRPIGWIPKFEAYQAPNGGGRDHILRDPVDRFQIPIVRIVEWKTDLVHDQFMWWWCIELIIDASALSKKIKAA